MKKQFLAVLLALAMVLSLLPMTAAATTYISNVYVADIDQPEAGKTPDSKAVVHQLENYAIFSQPEWYDETDGRFLEDGDTFEAGHIYEVNVWLEAKDGCEFYTQNGKLQVTGEVNGERATVNKAYEYQAWAMVEVRYTFPVCAYEPIKFIELTIDAPEQGKRPSFVMNDFPADCKIIPYYTQYHWKSGISWSDVTTLGNEYHIYESDTFQPGHYYVVSIALQPLHDSQYFPKSVNATVNGKKAIAKWSNEKTCVVEYNFTCYGSVYGYEINPVIILPKEGATPDTGAYWKGCKNIDDFWGPYWYDDITGKRISSEDTFQAGGRYHVEMSLRPNYSYRLVTDANGNLTHTPMVTGEYVDSYAIKKGSYGEDWLVLTKNYTIPGEWKGETPAETEKPKEAEKPIEVEKPVEVEKPAEAEKPKETEKTEVPAASIKVETPAETEKTKETEKPKETGKPTEIVKPADSETPLVKVNFTDVKAGAYYEKPVQWAVAAGITSGTTKTTFSPDMTCSQAHILTFLWRSVGKPASNIANPYSDPDVTESKYYYTPFVWAWEKGMIGDTKHDPDAPCSRADVVTYLWKLEGKPDAPKSAFTDVSAAADYAKAVDWAVANGITSGTSKTTFSPAETCTRGQIVTFLWRYVNGR